MVGSPAARLGEDLSQFCMVESCRGFCRGRWKPHSVDALQGSSEPRRGVPTVALGCPNPERRSIPWRPASDVEAGGAEVTSVPLSRRLSTWHQRPRRRRPGMESHRPRLPGPYPLALRTFYSVGYARTLVVPCHSERGEESRQLFFQRTAEILRRLRFLKMAVNRVFPQPVKPVGWPGRLAAGPRSPCENFVWTVIPSSARSLARSVFKRVRGFSAPATPRNDMEK